jgi:hypothetical protein
VIRSTVLVFALMVGCAGYSHLLASDTSDSTRPRIRAIRIDGDLVITGKLSDARWNLAETTELKYEIQPGENTLAPQRTTVRILYNSEYVYFGFDCQDTNPSAIRAHITDRDKLYDDDYIGIILDTYGDYQRA